MDTNALAPLITPALVIALFAWLRSDLRRLAVTVKSDIADVRREVAGVKAEVAEVRTQVADLGHQVADLGHQVGDLRERMAKLEGTIDGFVAGRRDRDAA